MIRAIVIAALLVATAGGASAADTRGLEQRANAFYDRLARGDTTGARSPQLRRRIRLTLAEVRRLFNVRDQAKQAVHAAINWSTYRREHQAEARAHHFTRRLKIQYLAL